LSRLAKLGLVIGGYVLACLVAGITVYIYQLLTQDAAAQASSGMFAFGDLLLFIGVFVFLMLFPTGLALYYLFRKFQTR
jgi:hypothetical protein